MNLKTVLAILGISFMAAIYMQFTGMGGRTVPHFSGLQIAAFIMFVILLISGTLFVLYKRSQ